MSTAHLPLPKDDEGRMDYFENMINEHFDFSISKDEDGHHCLRFDHKVSDYYVHFSYPANYKPMRELIEKAWAEMVEWMVREGLCVAKNYVEPVDINYAAEEENPYPPYC